MSLLVGYSDSESDGEAPSAPQVVAKPTAKPAFHKVVDRSHPGRIKVNLPGASQSHSERDHVRDNAPPSKKPRLDRGSSFGGFNAMLPAPKKPNVNAIAASEGSKTGNRGLGKRLASGINLKTGAEPAFQRESKVDTDEYDETGNPIEKEPMKREDFRAMLNLSTPKSEIEGETMSEIPTQETKVESELQQVPKPAAPRFVPMSVGKGKKKKPAAPRPAATSNDASTATSTSTSSSTPQSQQPPSKTKPRKPKVSLFGVSNETDPAHEETSKGHYQPILYGAEEGGDVAMARAYDIPPGSQHTQYAPPSTGGQEPDNLTNIASELKLSEAERRQLLGKKGRGGPAFSGANVKDFNTDVEYAHNEKLRQQGESVQHNPLKSISGTGKNSLRNLVNVATTQKDALEDHFAAGARNKREAGNRYGW